MAVDGALRAIAEGVIEGVTFGAASEPHPLPTFLPSISYRKLQERRPK